MEQRGLGTSGLRVSAVGLGTMMFGAWGNSDATECRRMVDIAIDAGVTLFDTADIYDTGVSETVLGEALRGRRDRVILATKFGNQMGDDPDRSGGSLRWIKQAIEGSLRRLGTDYIDLYQMHRPDPMTPIEETLGALHALVQAGQVREIGTSCFPAESVVEWQWAAQRNNWTAPRAEQPPYSCLARGVERAVLPTCKRHGVGVLAWAPLNGGWLTGKYQLATVPTRSRAEREPDHFDHASSRDTKVALVDQLGVIANEAGLTIIGLALGFVLAHPAVSSALIGPRTPEQCAQLLARAGTRLDASTLAAIDALIPPGTDVNPADAGYVNPALDRANW